MANAYHHLTCDERCQIDMMKESGEAAIARRRGRNPSTISRELTRNASQHDPSSGKPTRDAGQRDYDFAQADRLAAERRSAASAQPRDPRAVERSRREAGPAPVSERRVAERRRPQLRKSRITAQHGDQRAAGRRRGASASPTRSAVLPFTLPPHFRQT